MTLETYYAKVEKSKFEEYPEVMFDGMSMLKDFLNFDDLSTGVKIHLASMLIRRSVGIQSGIYMADDVHWLIDHFMSEYKTELADRGRYSLNKRAIEMVISENNFTDCIIGTVFMYTAIEFYLKYMLGFRFYANNEEEELKNKKFYRVSIGAAYQEVKEGNYRVSKEFVLIDDHFTAKSKRMGFEEEDLNIHLLKGRLTNYRNSSLHGHYQWWHAEGTLLVLLFILLHYCELEKKQ